MKSNEFPTDFFSLGAFWEGGHNGDRCRQLQAP